MEFVILIFINCTKSKKENIYMYNYAIVCISEKKCHATFHLTSSQFRWHNYYFLFFTTHIPVDAKQSVSYICFNDSPPPPHQQLS